MSIITPLRITCIYHSIDLDGWMSAAIVKLWHNKINDYPDNVGKGDIDFIEYNYGQPIPNLSGYDKIIMCDISFPKEIMVELSPKLTWIDHHISAIKDMASLDTLPFIEGMRNDKFAACELTWKFLFPDDPMPEIVRLLGRYDCFGHKGTGEEKMVLEFQYGARQCITDYKDAYSYLLSTERADIGVNTLNGIWDNGKAIYSFLCTNAKQIYKTKFVIYFSDPIQTDKKYKFVAINDERFNPINFGIDYHSEGYDGAACFSYNGTKWTFSLYNDNGKVDCSSICKQHGGGGHKGAAGFVTDNIYQFIK